MTKAQDRSPRFVGDERSPEERAELRGASAGIVVGLGAFFAVRHFADASGGLVPTALYDVPFLLLSVSMLYAGYWLLNCDADHRRVTRVALWSLAGFLALVAVGVWVSGGRVGDAQTAARLAVDVGTVGASSGLLVGLEGERRRRKLDRSRHLAVDRTEARFAFFNRLLRHHLLNGVAVVRGHAELLAGTSSDPPEAVDVIRRRCDEIVDLVKVVETLSMAFTGDLAVRAVDPAEPFADAVRSARADGAEVVVIGDYDGRRVRANDRIGLVFGAVLDASVEAAEDGRVTVETTSVDGEFLASFAFDGSLALGPDAAVRPGEYGDEDLELFLAETLCAYFGGSLDLPPEGPGSMVTLRLPLAD